MGVSFSFGGGYRFAEIRGESRETRRRANMVVFDLKELLEIYEELWGKPYGF